MNKYAFLFVVIFCSVLWSCKDDCNGVVGPDVERHSVYFEEKEAVLLPSKDSNLVLKTLGEKDWFVKYVVITDSSKVNKQVDNINVSDTVQGNWYTIIKNEHGESLSVSVLQNEEKKRSLEIYIGFKDIVSPNDRCVLVQEGNLK
jgi:lipoprotein